MDADLALRWRRGALALAVPAVCFVLMALICVTNATSRALRHGRSTGIVTSLISEKKAGYRPVIDYQVGETIYRIQATSAYSEQSYAIGQNVTVLYTPDRPHLGLLNSFREQWKTSLFLSIAGLAFVAISWKARTGLTPILHAFASSSFFILGALAGALLFTVLCARGGIEIFAGAPILVSLIGGMLIFFTTIPLASCGSLALWQSHVPARCPRCSGPMRVCFIGRQVIYTCNSCGHRPWGPA